MFITFALLFFGCRYEEDEPEIGVFDSPCFVQLYINATDFILYDDDRIDDAGNYAIRIVFEGEMIRAYHWKEKRVPVFNGLAVLYKDTNYNKKLMPGYNRALTSMLDTIQITCDKDYDEQHKAEASIGDMVTFCATTPYHFIQRGYREEEYPNQKYPDYWQRMWMHQVKGYEPVEMPANEFDKEKTLLTYPFCHLYFKKRPQHGGDYTFTVSIQFNGKVVSKKITHHF